VQASALWETSAAGDPRSQPRPIRLPVISAGVHIVAIYSRLAERDALLLPYLRDGLAREHSCTACIASGAFHTVLDHLSRDLDIDAIRASGQLEVCHAPDWPLAPAPSGTEAALTLWDRVVAQRLRTGFRCARFSVDASSWLSHLSPRGELLRFESSLTSLASGQPIAFMFLYDMSNLDGGLLVELVRTHPAIWTSGGELANPYFTVA
jgi:hypothetical protein